MPVQAEGKRLAQVYVIDPTLNRAGWKAKHEAIERARASLMKQPLLYEPGPNETPDWVEADAPFWGGTHQGEWVRAGQPVHLDEGKDGSFHVTYDITSDHAWEDIVNRRAKAASPSCEIYDARLTRPREGGPAELELLDLEFNHTLLIPPGGEGAYPNAGVENFWETQASWSGFTGAVASALNEVEEVAESGDLGDLDEGEEGHLESVLEQAGVDLDETTVDAAQWAQKAVKKPGRVRKYLESRGMIKKGAPIPMSMLQSLFKKTKDPSLRAAFLLAIRFKKGLKKKGVVGGVATVQPSLTTEKGELIASEQPLTDRITMSAQPDLQKQIDEMNNAIKTRDTTITAKDTELQARAAKILELQKSLQEAGLSLKAHEEGLGVAHLEAKYKDAQAEVERLTKELTNTAAQGRLVGKVFAEHIAGETADYRIEAGLLKPNDRSTYIAEAIKLPVDSLMERLAEAQAVAQKFREIGLGRRETYGAGAAVPPPLQGKDLGYTLGDLTGVYGGKQ